MNDLSNNWNNYSNESKMLHKKYYELSEELHKLLMNNCGNKENITYLRSLIVSIEKEIDSLKQKYYDSFDYSLYRPEGSNF